ncbi:MAG: hypothetical protein IJ849_03835 [Selenomonadaceae bacterium]|nr:hypothetical protein [Selenomonadaceae bacterium]
MEKIENAKMEEQELEQVAGGTLTEMVELFRVFESRGHGKNKNTIGVYLPGFNEIAKSDIKSRLKNDYGIEANIDIGWLGVGIASENNMYKDIKTGKALTHQEVMQRIK